MARKDKATSTAQTPPPPASAPAANTKPDAPTLRLTRNFKGRQIGEVFSASEAERLNITEACEKI
jgi:hypothetical protein